MEGRKRSLLFTISALLGLIVLAPQTHAYDEFTHEWVTRSAIDYLRDHPHLYPETDGWILKLGLPRGFAEDALVRAVVDTDYKTDMWLNAWFHAPFTGAQSGSIVVLFTSYLHFLNVTTPGDYWEHDGYAYRHSTKQGADKYLDIIKVRTQERNSAALGGGRDLEGFSLGPYNQGFNGTQSQWNTMFNGGSASDAVFPPSTVPAQLAYNYMIQSDRARSDRTDIWNLDLPLVSGVFSTSHLKRHYWRGEAEGLPQAWDMLGMAMHLLQDATVPHHVEGTSDNCHAEYEAWLDQVTCGSLTPMNRDAYSDGSYTGHREGCGLLYNADLVTQILNENPVLSATSEISVSERMVEIAKITAQWKWQTSNGNRLTFLPQGQTFSAKECTDLFLVQPVIDQARFQYNLAIAQSVALFEKAAHEYEMAHVQDPPSQVTEIMDWFKEHYSDRQIQLNRP